MQCVPPSGAALSYLACRQVGEEMALGFMKRGSGGVWSIGLPIEVLTRVFQTRASG